MKFFDMSENNLSYKKAAGKITVGLVISLLIILFRVFVTLEGKADAAVSTAGAILVVVFLALALTGAAEAVIVSMNRKRERVSRGEAGWEPVRMSLGEVYGLLEVSDIISFDLRLAGKAHVLSAQSDCGRGANYTYNKRYIIDGQEFKTLDELAESETAAEMGLDDTEIMLSVAAIGGIDPREFTGGKA